jgi:hypothetical protein
MIINIFSDARQGFYLRINLIKSMDKLSSSIDRTANILRKSRNGVQGLDKIIGRASPEAQRVKPLLHSPKKIVIGNFTQTEHIPSRLGLAL